MFNKILEMVGLLGCCVFVLRFKLDLVVFIYGIWVFLLYFLRSEYWCFGFFKVFSK